MFYDLKSQRTLIVRGPATVRLLTGDAEVLGGPIDAKRRIIVREEKQLPIETLSHASLEIRLKDPNQITEIDGSTIPASWSSAAEVASTIRKGKVVVIGAADFGKSTLCTYLTNRLVSSGAAVRVLDADIGQADIGPPTTVSEASTDTFVSSLSDLNPEAALFVGHTTPGRVESKLTDSVRRLIARGSDSITIVNTDGWILDPSAIHYKMRLIEAIKPQFLIGISNSDEIDELLARCGTRWMKVQVSEVALMRSRGDRRDLRAAGYRRFLEGAVDRKIPLSSVKLVVPERIRGSDIWGMRLIENVLVGLLDSEGYLSQIGILKHLGRGTVTVFSRLTGIPKVIEVGYVLLTHQGVEIGYLDLP